MNYFIKLAENGTLSDSIIRFGIRRLNQSRLKSENAKYEKGQERAINNVLEDMKKSPIAQKADKANEQHYEVPADFFQKALGSQLKYSSCYWDEGVENLDQAEERMLELTCERAQLENGMKILELGCGWGSLSLWMAEHFKGSQIVSVSNSNSQRKFIEGRAKDRGLSNIKVITSDMNDFDIQDKFDRIVSVEMFEHMRNWHKLLEKINRWLKPEGRLFIHIFTHKTFAYFFEDQGSGDWMSRNFFSGGLMPSQDLLSYFSDFVVIEKQWHISGTHYQKTLEAWLKKTDKNKKEILGVFEKTFDKKQSAVMLQKWRMFFMACAEFFGASSGEEWMVSHYLLKKAESKDI